MTVVLASHALARADEPYFMGLGLLPATDSTRPAAIAGDGSTVVGWSPGACDRSFHWTLEAGIGDFEELSSWCGHGAAGISADGQTIVGNSGWGPPSIYVLTALDGFTPVPEVKGLWSESFGLSGDGNVIVGTVWVPNASPPVTQAARWIWTGNEWIAQVLGDLPGGYTQGRGLATSHDGSVVVGSGMISFEFVEEAFRWTAEDGMQGLGGPPGYVESFASACSGDGAVVAGYYTPGWTGFRWTAETGMVALGEIPGGGGTRVRAISADGSVIGGGSGAGNAFIWDEKHGVRRLSDVLEQDYGLDLQGFNLCCLEALSSDGQTMTGRGINADGVLESWIAHLGEACVADATGDGDVDVDDLVAVLLAMDTTNDAADVNQDGIVDVDDLVQVILAWGSC
jgi:uncharacterized membrane protein